MNAFGIDQEPAQQGDINALSVDNAEDGLRARDSVTIQPLFQSLDTIFSTNKNVG